ncbi:phage tail tape measure protein [Amniculibacterium sp. G2-70]|uniref:phage tail tape measure protein n=1 Tax=Amniculibacterium sp. G2-70 TaxID=2767188 RepID=UPI00165435D7|nr:phage tail tape measure protein [Amniculibacterium sp. G2-70]
MATSKLTMLIDMSTKMFNSKLSQLQGKWSQTVGKMEAKYRGLIDNIGGGDFIDQIKNPAAALAVAGAAAFAFVGKSTAMANDWHTKMAEINVTAELSKTQLQGLSDKLLDIGARNVAPLDEVPKAFGRIISAGLSVKDSLTALEPTMRAAKAGFTDIETVASAGIATMMSSGKDINKVYDVLFETVKEGNAEFKDIARYLPKVVPLARSIGYELESTAGAFASLTTKLSAEQSSTALEGVMRTLSNADVAMGKMDAKTGKYVSGFRAVGINIFDSAGKIRPLIDIVKDLNKSFEGLTNEQKIEKLSKLGFDQATALGFGTLMQDVEGLEKATRATSFAQGALNKAYMDSLTPTEQWSVIQNNIKASMIKLGEKILPYVTLALEKLTPVFEWMYQNIDTIIPVLGTFAAILGVVAAAGFLAMLPISGTAVAIAALIALVVLAIKKYNQWGATLLWFLGPIGRVISAFKLIYDHWDSIKKAFQNDGIVGGLKRIGQVLSDVILQPLEQLLGLLSKLPGSLGKVAREAQASVHKFRGSQNLVTDNEKIQNALSAGKLVMYNGVAMLPTSKAKYEALAAAKEKEKEKNSLYNPLDPTKGGAFSDGLSKGDKTKNKLGKDVDKISGAAKEVKNITVKFDSIHKGDNIVNGGGGKGMSMEDFENFYNEMMMRILRNLETS